MAKRSTAMSSENRPAAWHPTRKFVCVVALARWLHTDLPISEHRSPGRELPDHTCPRKQPWACHPTCPTVSTCFIVCIAMPVEFSLSVGPVEERDSPPVEASNRPGIVVLLMKRSPAECRAASTQIDCRSAPREASIVRFGVTIAGINPRLEISEQTFHRGRSQYGGGEHDQDGPRATTCGTSSSAVLSAARVSPGPFVAIGASRFRCIRGST